MSRLSAVERYPYHTTSFTTNQPGTHGTRPLFDHISKAMLINKQTKFTPSRGSLG